MTWYAWTIVVLWCSLWIAGCIAWRWWREGLPKRNANRMNSARQDGLQARLAVDDLLRDVIDEAEINISVDLHDDDITLFVRERIKSAIVEYALMKGGELNVTDTPTGFKLTRASE